MLTIHGRATSVNVQAVMWLVGELGLQHRRADVAGAHGGNDTPAFLAMNPNGLVPVLEDGATVIFESRAIVRYLAAAHGGGRFWPADPAARAAVDQWAEWAKTTVYPPLINRVFRTLIRTRAADRDPARLAADLDAVIRLMAIAERQLDDRSYFVGDVVSLADISFGVMLYRYYTLEMERPDLPGLRRYYDGLCARPAYAEHVMVPYDSLRVE